MRKNNSVTLVLILLVASACLMAACSSPSVTPIPCPKSDEPLTVGEALEGRYSVGSYAGIGLDAELIVVGHLYLCAGRYEYVPDADGFWMMEDRFGFIKYPEGRYEIEYLSSEHTLMVELQTPIDYFAIITFYTDEGDQPESYDWKLFLQSEVESRKVNFHALYSEIGGWGITKLWDE